MKTMRDTQISHHGNRPMFRVGKPEWTRNGRTISPMEFWIKLRRRMGRAAAARYLREVEANDELLSARLHASRVLEARKMELDAKKAAKAARKAGA